MVANYQRQNTLSYSWADFHNGSDKVPLNTSVSATHKRELATASSWFRKIPHVAAYTGYVGIFIELWLHYFNPTHTVALQEADDEAQLLMVDDKLMIVICPSLTTSWH